MNTFLEKLADTSRSRNSSEHLKLLGKRAAGLFTRGEVDSLNDAVRQVLGEEDNLTREQVQRVAETANQSAWDEKFHRGGDAATQFEPASGSRVLESLAEKSVQLSEPNMDFQQDPPKESLPDVDLGELIGLKDEAPEYEALNPTGELEATKENVKAAADTMRYSVDKLAMALNETGEEFYQHVKQAHLKHDHGVVQIAKAISLVVDSPTFADEIMKTAAERLRLEGVRIDPKVEMSKLSEAVVVDEDHPLLIAAARFEKTAQAYHRASSAKAELEQQHDRVDGFLRDKARAT